MKKIRMIWRLPLFFANIFVLYFFMVFCSLLLHRRPEAKLRMNQRLLNFHIRIAFAILHVRVERKGDFPRPPCLMICNHLSYLDILVFMHQTRAIFVSKAEVKNWPIFGKFTTLSGAIYLKRESMKDLKSVWQDIRRVLEEKKALIFFPEGTSSGGVDVLPFNSSLFESIQGTSHPIHPVSIAYKVEDESGTASENVCYWKDHVFFPHVLGLLALKSVRAKIHVGPPVAQGANRKETAKRAREAVVSIFEKSE